MFDKEKIREELKEVPEDKLKEKTREILDKKRLESEFFLLKALIIEELIRRGRLSVLFKDSSGDPYKIRIETLKPQDIDLILRQYLYHGIRLECIIHEKGLSIHHAEETT